MIHFARDASCYGGRNVHSNHITNQSLLLGSRQYDTRPLRPLLRLAMRLHPLVRFQQQGVGYGDVKFGKQADQRGYRADSSS